MKIAIITPSFLPVPAVKGGAVETLIHLFISENENKANDLYITVFSSFDKDAFTLSKKYRRTKFVWIKNRNLGYKSIDFLIRVIRRILRLRINHLDALIIQNKMKHEYFDKVIIEGNPSHALEISKFVEKKKIYFHVHGNIFQHQNEYNNDITNACHQVITVSQFIKDQITKFTETPKSKVVVLLNCSNIKMFETSLDRNSRRDLRQTYGINADDIVILFVGRIVIEKGIVELVKALNLLGRDIPFKLVIAGSFGSRFGVGDGDKSIKKIVQIHSQSINDRIIYTGFLHNDQMPSVYSMSDLVVVPSLCEDAAPLVPLEAMASGLPLIVTNSGGMPEYINENCSMMIVKDSHLTPNLALAIEKLLNDNELRKRMGEAGRKHVQQYNSENYYANLLSIISNNV